MKTQCPHCNQNYDVDANVSGEIVTCQKCGQEFVADPIPVVHRRVIGGRQENSSSAPCFNENMMYCQDCGKIISKKASSCPHCGHPYSAVGGEDKLGIGFIVLFGVLLFIPFGGLIVIILSSILYYAWKKDYPKKAHTINMYGWSIFLISTLLGVILVSCSGK